MFQTELLQSSLRPVQECEALLARAKELVVIDLETTGFSEKLHAEIIEIGAVRVETETRKPISCFHRLIKPISGVIPKKITTITGITNEMVTNAPYFESVMQELYDYLGDSIVVAHNAKFDWFRFILPYMLKVGRVSTNDILCTMEISREMHPELKSHTLDSLCEYYGSPIKGHHRALTDATYTASIALKQRDEIISSPISVWEFEKAEPRIPPSTVEFADLSNLQIKYVKPYDYSDKRLGRTVFIATSAGTFYCNLKRRQWGIQKNLIEKNIRLEDAKKAILNTVNLSEDAFVHKYQTM